MDYANHKGIMENNMFIEVSGVIGENTNQISTCQGGY
jgi:hypothetical protein